MLIDTEQYQQFAGGDWSPDSNWVVYAKTGANLAHSIYLYSLDQKKSTQLTSGFYEDNSPVFDPEGKYLYFISQRFFYPTSGALEQRFNYYSTLGLFAITLKADEPSPFAPQSDEEKAADEKKDDKNKKDDKKAADKPAAAGDAAKKDSGEEKEKSDKDKKADEKEVKKTQIDLDQIGERIAPVPIPAGIYSGLLARKGKVFYMSTPMEATQAALPGPPQSRNAVHMYDLKAREDKVVIDGVDTYDLDKEGDKLVYASQDTYGVIDPAPGKHVGEGKLNTGALQSLVDPRAEWAEIFHEAWRIERDFYWDPNMGGLDWKKVGQRYEVLLPWVAHRADLNYIIGEMIAELSTSHTYVGAGDVPDWKHINVGMLGVDYEVDHDRYRFKKIYPGENWNDQTRSPLTEPGVKVKQGDYLIAVNGNEVSTSQNPYAYFQNLAGQVVTLKVNDKPSAEGAWEITVRPVGNENALRYHDWVEIQPQTCCGCNRRPHRLHARAGYHHPRRHHVR